MDGKVSSVRDVTSGVPQGSVLGPLLFLIYANCIASEVGSFWVAFADDFKLGISHTDGGPGDLQRDLDALCGKASSWNLKVNPEKCVAMRFGRVRRENLNATKYYVGGRELEFVDSYRDLGVVVDSSLKFHAHVNSVVGKAGAMMGELLRATVCRSRDFMLALFVSHIRPTIDYCSSVWNTGYLGDIRKMESVQRRWTREVAGLESLEYGSRLRELGLYSVRGRLLRADLKKNVQGSSYWFWDGGVKSLQAFYQREN